MDAFAASMGHWKPFPDTRDAILALQQFLKIVLITNTDDAIIAKTERNLGVKFDAIITAEQARKRLSLPVEEIWHAGFGFRYDIVPATERGYTTVWVNRQGEGRPLDVKETFLVGDMRTLVYLVRGIAAST